MAINFIQYYIEIIILGLIVYRLFVQLHENSSIEWESNIVLKKKTHRETNLYFCLILK